jgi:hypothetical protein
MNETETKPLPAFTEDSQRQGAALQGQVTTLLLATVVLSGILAAYLYVQQRFAIQDREVNKQLAGQFIQLYQKQQKPAMDNLVEKLRDYGKTHPDFLPVLNKYGYGLPTAGAAAAPSPPTKSVTPKPAPAAAPRK